MTDTSVIPELFSATRRNAKLRRAARMKNTDPEFLVEAAMDVICDRVSIINRTFSNVSTWDSPTPIVAERLTTCANVEADSPIKDLHAGHADEPKADLIVSVFGLHWQNDIPGHFSRIFRSLKPDGLFLCVLPGEGTLKELNRSLIKAETELSNGATMRVDPFPDVRQAGGLLQRAGFTLPVCDIEDFTVRYSELGKLVWDLRAMAATSSLNVNQKPLRRGIWKLAEKYYKNDYSNAEDRLNATFSCLFLSGWHPHDSQQKPAKRGSATHKLSDFL